MKPLALNIGSGQRPFDKKYGWVNIDKQARWNPDVLCDFGNPLDKLHLEDADIIVLHHVLEHYWGAHAQIMLEECRRILKPGGSLLVFVPNMMELSHMWHEGRLSDEIYMTNIYGAYMGAEEDRHKFGYTFRTLRAALYSAGFKNVHAFPMGREIQGAHFDVSRGTLAVEAIK
jgi:predicted SAM-dependent methyltransferase